MSKSKMSIGFVVVVLVLGLNFVSVKPATMDPPPVREWTCNGLITLIGPGYSYLLPPWQMFGNFPGPGTDREKRCKERIASDWLNNSAIWAKLGIPPAAQNSFCQSGGTFNVVYGFDERKKDWHFTQFGKPNCKCNGTMNFQ